MVDGVELKFTNLPDVINAMRNLESGVQRRVVRRATAKGARVIRDAVIINAKRLDDPKTARDISKNVAISWSSRLARQEGGGAYRVGIRGGAKDPLGKKTGAKGGDTFYWRFLEFGTVHMRARPFIRPALAQRKNEALQAAIDEALRLTGEEVAKARIKS